MKIGGVLIVKNEEKVIERCLNSIYDFCDEFLIIDTGSIDLTIQKIENFFKNSSKKLILLKRTWLNFEHNRTELLIEAKKNLNVDWLFTIDADMVLINNNFNKQILDKDVAAYAILQGDENKSFIYYNYRLLNNECKWRYIGKTHEYLDFGLCAKNKIQKIDPDFIYIKDYYDGGSRKEKFIRDINLLTDALNENPNDARSVFYLAQSYKDLSLYDKAIEFYNKRIDLNGWEEEVYYSYYMRSKCLEYLNKNEIEIISSYIESIEYNLNRNSKRLESVVSLLKYIRTINKHHNLIYNYLKEKYDYFKSINQSFLNEYLLFLESDCYEYRFDDEFSLLAYNSGDCLTSLKILNNLKNKILNNLLKIDENEKQRIINNFEIVKNKCLEYININNYFDKIYILNLSDRIDRKNKIKKRLKEFNITNYKFINSIPGFFFDSFNINKISCYKNDYFYNNNLIGCIFSHCLAVFDAKSNNYKNILILEDDALFYKDLNLIFPKIILESETKYDRDWDMLYLGHGTFYIENDKWIPEKIKLKENEFTAITNFGTWTGHAYAIKNTLYDIILDRFFKNDFSKWVELDRFYVNEIQTNNKYLCLKVYPQLFIQDIDYSDIIGKNKIENLNFINENYSKFEDYI